MRKGVAEFVDQPVGLVCLRINMRAPILHTGAGFRHSLPIGGFDGANHIFSTAKACYGDARRVFLTNGTERERRMLTFDFRNFDAVGFAGQVRSESMGRRKLRAAYLGGNTIEGNHLGRSQWHIDGVATKSQGREREGGLTKQRVSWIRKTDIDSNNISRKRNHYQIKGPQ